MLAEAFGNELRYVPVKDDLTLDMEAYEASIEGAGLVCVVHTSNVLGVRNPIEDIIRIAHENGARVLLDAAQGAPHCRINMAELGADMMALSAHKMCGPTGIGCLLVNEETFQEMKPFMGGGDMIETVTLEDPPTRPMSTDLRQEHLESQKPLDGNLHLTILDNWISMSNISVFSRLLDTLPMNFAPST